jgi:hypothetical protein
MGKFRKGEKRPANAGRRRGSVNKTTGLLKEAILRAAELEGDVSLKDLENSPLENENEVVKKRGGLVGYLRYIARNYPEKFVASLLARVLPMEVSVDARSETVYRTVSEIKEAMARRGIQLDAVAPLLIEAPKAEPQNEEEDAAPDQTVR